jgi:hypothetical protein
MNRNLETLRQQRDELYQDARNHPDSDADQMVQILLLSAMSNQQGDAYDADFGAARADERRAYRQARAKRAQQRQQAQPGEAADDAAPGGDTAGGEADDEVDNLSPEMRLEKIAQALEDAKSAAESGKEMDPMKIYNKIAEVIGLRPYADEKSDAEKAGFGV